MKKPLHPVTDHAVLRYLERVEGMDIERLRRLIGRQVDRAIELGASKLHHDGFTYVLVEGVVVTIQETCRPERGKGRPK